MVPGTIQISHQRLRSLDIKDICETLDTQSVKILSLRHCKISRKCFKELMQHIGTSTSILQLNLNLGAVDKAEKVEELASCLKKNRSLHSLLIHGSKLGRRGMTILHEALVMHPNIICLDIGDCQLDDHCVPYISELLPNYGAKPGLKDLILSANPNITCVGWTQFFMAIAAGNNLTSLQLDYNQIGDGGVSCLAVALISTPTLMLLDLEGTGITDQGAETLLHLIQKYQINIQQLVLKNNTIKSALKKKIKRTQEEFCVTISDTDDTEDDVTHSGSELHLKEEASLMSPSVVKQQLDFTNILTGSSETKPERHKSHSFGEESDDESYSENQSSADQDSQNED